MSACPLWAALVLAFGLVLLSASPALADPGALEQVSAGSNVARTPTTRAPRQTDGTSSS